MHTMENGVRCAKHGLTSSTADISLSYSVFSVNNHQGKHNNNCTNVPL